MRKITIGIAVVMLVGVVLIGITPSRESNQRAVMTKYVLRDMDAALQKFKQDFGRYPHHLAELGVTAHQKERYLIEHWGASDAWGHAFQYDLTGDSGDAYDLYSLGEDGIAHSSDDIRPPP